MCRYDWKWYWPRIDKIHYYLNILVLLIKRQSNVFKAIFYQVILICPSDDTHTQRSLQGGQEESLTWRVQGLQPGEDVFYAALANILYLWWTAWQGNEGQRYGWSRRLSSCCRLSRRDRSVRTSNPVVATDQLSLADCALRERAEGRPRTICKMAPSCSYTSTLHIIHTVTTALSKTIHIYIFIYPLY
jgi:hypothetical protein